jgi:hypothetical protein
MVPEAAISYLIHQLVGTLLQKPRLIKFELLRSGDVDSQCSRLGASDRSSL